MLNCVEICKLKLERSLSSGILLVNISNIAVTFKTGTHMIVKTLNPDQFCNLKVLYLMPNKSPPHFSWKKILDGHWMFAETSLMFAISYLIQIYEILIHGVKTGSYIL